MNNAIEEDLSREAKSIVALAFRNGPIEEIHTGNSCPTCVGQTGYSRITQAEMKAIMKNAVSQVYRLLWLKSHDPEQYRQRISFGIRYTGSWDEPESP